MKFLTIPVVFALLASLCGHASAASAVATYASDASDNNLVFNQATVAQAEKLALKNCNIKLRKNKAKGKCAIVISSDEPGFIAISYGDGGAGYATSGTVQGAVDTAVQACTEKYKNCNTKNVAYWTDDGAPTATPANTASCIPNTAVRQCRSQCTNGNCLVTYQNGCQVRVQMQSRYNGLNGMWEYPSPSC